MINMPYKEIRIGQTRPKNCGMEATIIEYRRCDDIDVRFGDGTIVEHRRYDNFISGNISNPNCTNRPNRGRGHVSLASSRLGEKKTMRCGMEATIIEYRRCDDIDVRFGDGTIVEHRRYENFISGNISNPNCTNRPNRGRGRVSLASSRLGEKKTMRCGMEATIIEYRRSDDIDVEFGDGTIVKNKTYQSFMDGKIANPNCKHKRMTLAGARLGITRGMNCGMEATIIEYRRSDDIDVKFDDGAIVKNKTYQSFMEGKIANPNLKQRRLKLAEARLGETRMMNCGTEATIIAYHKYHDIDVQFADGTVVRGRRYSNFKEGGIGNPNYFIGMSLHIGETQLMNCGMEATIIAYNNSHNIDVQFADGTVVRGRKYSKFKEGSIGNPNYRAPVKRKTFAEIRLGETRTMNHGMKATIVAYNNSHDIDIQLENGALLKGKRYSDFLRGGIVRSNKRFFEEYYGVPLGNNIQKDSENLKNAVPKDVGYVYMMYLNKEKEPDPVYIGKTKDIHSRLREHFLKKNQGKMCGEIYDEVTEIKYAEVGTYDDAGLIERFLIGKYKPIGNTEYMRNNYTLPIDLSFLKWNTCTPNDLP